MVLLVKMLVSIYMTLLQNFEHVVAGIGILYNPNGYFACGRSISKDLGINIWFGVNRDANIRYFL